MVSFYGYGTFAIPTANTWLHIGKVSGIQSVVDRYLATYSASGKPYDGVARVDTVGNVYLLSQTAKTNANLVIADIFMVN